MHSFMAFLKHTLYDVLYIASFQSGTMHIVVVVGNGMQGLIP